MAFRDKIIDGHSSGELPDTEDGMVLTPVISIEPSMNWVYDAHAGKWSNIETGEVRNQSPSNCGEDSPEDYPQAQIVEGEAFFLTPQQIRAGIRLAIDETGQIRACPSCGKRQVIVEQTREACANASGESPSCGYGRPDLYRCRCRMGPWTLV